MLSSVLVRYVRERRVTYDDYWFLRRWDISSSFAQLRKRALAIIYEKKIIVYSWRRTIIHTIVYIGPRERNPISTR